MAIKNSRFNLDNFDIEEKEVKEESDSKYCTSCKAKNILKAKFCFECGNNKFYSSLEEMNDVANFKYCVK